MVWSVSSANVLAASIRHSPRSTAPASRHDGRQHQVCLLRDPVVCHTRRRCHGEAVIHWLCRIGLHFMSWDDQGYWYRCPCGKQILEGEWIRWDA